MFRSRSHRALVGAWLAGLLFAGGALAQLEVDPVHVYFRGRGCVAKTIDLEIWDRSAKAWRKHPRHHRVPIPSCQLEDAGRLWNELRWRCTPASKDAPTPWRELSLIDGETLTRCALGQVPPAERRSAISVDEPVEGVALGLEEPAVVLRGSVRVDGADGSQYDLVLLIDRSLPSAGIHAQVDAARTLVARLAPRLGTVRVSVYSFPSRAAPDGSGRGVRREVGWTKSAAQLDAALVRVRNAGRVGSPRGPGAAAEALIRALEGFEGTRPAARPVVALGIDGSRIDAPGPPPPGDPLLAAASKLLAAGVDLHWRVLGGVAAASFPRIDAALEAGRGGFLQLPPEAWGRSFWRDLELPVTEAVWIENAVGGRSDARSEPGGRFTARVPVAAGLNALHIYARLSDGSLIEKPYSLLFSDRLILERILEEERERIRNARRKRLELRTEAR